LCLLKEPGKFPGSFTVLRQRRNGFKTVPDGDNAFFESFVMPAEEVASECSKAVMPREA
jgi:hypothetical protein